MPYSSLRIDIKRKPLYTPVMKSALLLFGMLSALLLPVTLYGADTAASAASLAEKFSSEMLLALKDMEKRGGFDEYKKERTVAKKNLAERLKTIRWTTEPGKRKNTDIAKLLGDFASQEADSLAGLARLAPPADKKYIAAMKRALSALKEKMLQELEDSFKKEESEKARLKEAPPMPSVDASPFEDNDKGIYNR